MTVSSALRFVFVFVWFRRVFNGEVDKGPAAHEVLLDAAREACHVIGLGNCDECDLLSRLMSDFFG
jgi:hypothetical protein